MPRTTIVALLLATALAVPAEAHAPTTAIGRAVEALLHVDVSYDPGSKVTEVEAGGFDLIAGDGVFVHFLPAAALNEIRGGPANVAAEIVREAGLNGTLVALVGPRLTAWSDDIDESRLARLQAVARAEPGSPVAQARALVQAVRTEQRDDGGPPWAWDRARREPAARRGRRGRAPPDPVPTKLPRPRRP
jgi:hypothetical protein